MQQRIDKIEEEMDYLNRKDDDRKELELEIALLRKKLVEEGKESVSNELVDSYKIEQLKRELS